MPFLDYVRGNFAEYESQAKSWSEPVLQELDARKRKIKRIFQSGKTLQELMVCDKF